MRDCNISALAEHAVVVLDRPVDFASFHTYKKF